MMKQFRAIKVILFCLAWITLFSIEAGAQEWAVPADKAAKLSPFEFGESTVVAGKEIFRINCISCHGTPTQANFQPLVPPPGDPASEKFRKDSDGTLYYKITGGRGLMPSFRNVLSANDIWTVISYIRSFHEGYEQSVAQATTLANMKWSFIKIILSHNEGDEFLQATLSGLEEDRWTPVPGTEVQVSVKRTFGQLVIDEPKTTDSQGIAIFNIPEDLPSDRDGKIELLARITDEENFGIITADTLINAGAANDAPSLVQQRAMWNRVTKAPLWITILYPLAVLTVWGLILLVMLNLRAIYIVGEEKENEETQ